jgi:hypothetical protein
VQQAPEYSHGPLPYSVGIWSALWLRMPTGDYPPVLKSTTGQEADRFEMESVVEAESNDRVVWMWFAVESAAEMEDRGPVDCQALLLESWKIPTLCWRLEEANTEVERSTQALMRVVV